MIIRGMLFYCLLVLFACSQEKLNTTLFERQQSVGTISKNINEASGLVASIANPGYLWTHNDGRNPAEVFLINEKAETVMTCKLKNTFNRDWEDIAIGPGPEAGVNYLYIGDIGDNDADYPYKILYRIKEPQFSDSTSTEIEIDEIEKLVFALPDGKRDSEAMMVDPLTNKFYLFSKREPSIRLYEIKFPTEGDTLKVDKLTKLPFNRIVAASISADGSEVIIKDYQYIFYWRRNDQEALQDLLLRNPVKIYYEPESQGEAISWKRDGTGFYTLSESGLFAAADLFFYRRR